MNAIKLLFMPITWAIGFLLPLFAQSILALDLTDSVVAAYTTAALVALPLGLVAQVRGSWIWVK